MIYGEIKNVGKKVSRLVFGCANSLMISGGDASKALDSAMDLGINTFDTAENYGLSELSLGNWIRERNNRDNVVIISKGCHPYGTDRVTPEDLKQDIEQSFKRLGTDYIDIYLMHRDNKALDPAPMVEILNEYHSKGLIGAFGGSNWTHDRIELANNYAREHGFVEFTVSSPGFSLARTARNPWIGDGVSISGPENVEARKWYKENKMPVIAFSSLGRGFLSGKIKKEDSNTFDAALDEPAKTGFVSDDNILRLERAEKLASEKGATASQIALAYLFNQKFEVYPIVTSLKPEHIASNAESLNIKLTEEECLWLDLEI